MSSTNFALYSIEQASEANTLNVTALTGISGLDASFSLLFTFDLEDKDYLVGFDPNALMFVFYQINTDPGEACSAVVFEKISTADSDTAWDSVSPFLLGGNPCFIAYNQESGLIRMYGIAQDLSITILLDYKRDATKGLTTVAPFTYRYGVYMVAYDNENGEVNYYQLTVPSDDALYMTSIWSDKWAKGWTRFAFFKWGGENFFLKQNPVYNNVNIDHIMSDPTEGSHPVGTHLDLEMDLNIIVTFTLPDENPYFVAYKNDGTATFNRFNGSGQSWQLEANETILANANQLIPFSISDVTYLLVYGGQQS